MAILDIEHLFSDYAIRDRLGRRSGVVQALRDVSFSISRGEVFGIVGETGSGKSTLAKTLAGIKMPTSGTVKFSGTVVAAARRRIPKTVRARLQYVYQDPGASLDPRWTIRRSLHEPLIIHTSLNRIERENRIFQTIEALEFAPELLERYPHQLSGGQQRRMGLARTMVLAPEFVLFDEPTAGLDLLVQSSVINLLKDLRRDFGLTYMLITHDMSVVEATCDRVGILYQGHLIEVGPTKQVFGHPAHPYTQALIGSSVRIGGVRVTDNFRREKSIAAHSRSDFGCVYRSKCQLAFEACAIIDPKLVFEKDRGVACLLAKSGNEPNFYEPTNV